MNRNPKTSANKSARNAVLISTFLAVFLTAISIAFSPRGGSIEDPLFLATLVIATLVTIVCAWLSYKGYTRQSMFALIITYLAALIANQLDSAGDGLLNALVATVFAIGIAVPTLSGKWLNYAVLTGGIVAVLIMFIDLFGPPNRAVYVYTTGDYALITVLAGVLLFIAVRGFRNYSLLTKLVGAFLLVALLPMIVVFIINDNTSRQNLTNDANRALAGISAETATSLDGFITDNLNLVRTSAQLHILQDYLALPVSERPGSETETALYIDLSAIASRDPTYVTSVGLLDVRGMNVADTLPSEIGGDLSDRNYFNAPIQTGLPYSSPVQASRDTVHPSMYFSAPVRDPNGNIIGILRVRYDAAILQQLITATMSSLRLGGGKAILFDENHIILANSEAPELLYKSVVPLPADTFAQLQAERRLPDGTAEELSINLPEFEQGLINAEIQPIFAVETTPGGQGIEQVAVGRMGTQPWKVVIAQTQSVFLAPVTSQTQNNLVVALIVTGLVSVAAFIIGQLLSRPIIGLTAIAQQIAGGDLNVQAPVRSEDETGQLAAAFNNMTTQLRQAFEAVRRRALAVETSAEVSRRLAAVLSPRQLALDVVEQVQSAFHYYHAHIYYLDETSGDLVMAGGTGEAGATMLGSGHKIPKGRGLVGRAAESNVPVLVPDVSQEERWLPNPLLPETKAEIAMPISLGEQVLGVLDVQHNLVGGLDEEDVALLQAVSGQVAISLQNARAFEASQAQADFEAKVGAISQRIQRAVSIEDTLQTAVRELGAALGARRVVANIQTSRQVGGDDTHRN